MNPVSQEPLSARCLSCGHEHARQDFRRDLKNRRKTAYYLARVVVRLLDGGRVELKCQKCGDPIPVPWLKVVVDPMAQLPPERSKTNGRRVLVRPKKPVEVVDG